jgi:hypothetical protein
MELNMSKKKDDSTERTKRYRERKRENERIQDAWEWFENWDERYQEQAAEVDDYVRNTQRTIVEELGRKLGGCLKDSTGRVVDDAEEETLDRILRSLYAFKKDTSVWVRQTTNGIIVAGMYHPDVLGYDIVAATHRRNLEISPTYSAVYRELLSILDQRFGNNQDRDSATIKRELAGKVVLPVEPETPRLPVA